MSASGLGSVLGLGFRVLSFNGTCSTPNKTANNGTCSAPNKTANNGTCSAPNKTANNGTCSAPNKTANNGTCSAPNKTANNGTCPAPKKKEQRTALVQRQNTMISALLQASAMIASQATGAKQVRLFDIGFAQTWGLVLKGLRCLCYT